MKQRLVAEDIEQENSHLGSPISLSDVFLSWGKERSLDSVMSWSLSADIVDLF